MKTFLRAAVMLLAMLAASRAPAVVLTDATVFSTNEEGNNYLSLIWNTQAPPEDVPDRWNLYISDSADPSTPTFINGFNDAQTNIAVNLTPGIHTFDVFANGVGTNFGPEVHWVLNLYFNGSGAPSISGITGATCPSVCPAGHPNGLDILGNAGAPEAGTLQASFPDALVTLVSFSWNTSPGIDVVWPHWHNAAPYDSGGEGPDYLGRFSLRVAAEVPEPSTVALLLLSFLLLIGTQRRSSREALLRRQSNCGG
jgi:hypothetical protein